MSAAPLSAVLDAVEAGATTRPAVAARTGLDPVVVDAAIDHLVRLGRVTQPSLAFGCPTSGCGGCVAVQGCVGGPTS